MGYSYTIILSIVQFKQVAISQCRSSWRLVEYYNRLVRVAVGRAAALPLTAAFEILWWSSSYWRLLTKIKKHCSSPPVRVSLNHCHLHLHPLLKLSTRIIVVSCKFSFISAEDNDSTDCCMVFVDDNGRVYQDWDDYLENNNLPEGILVAPRKGYYNFNEGGQVLLQCEETPAAKPLSKAGDVINTTAGIAGLGAAGVTIASLALPVAAPVLIGAAVVGIGSGICGAVSSIVRLVDRGKHEENINLSNSQARADWLGVAGGVVSVGASGATSVLSRFAATGRNVSSVRIWNLVFCC